MKNRAGLLLLVQDDNGAIVDHSLSTGDWLQAGVIILAAILAAVVGSAVTRWLIHRWVGQGFAALVTARLISYAVVLLGVFYALTSLGVHVGPLLGALGLGGLVLALALQKVVENFVAAIILQTRRPFTIGETVIAGGVTGLVVDIDARTTVLHDLDGRIVRVPNANVLAENTINLTRRPFRRSALEVGVAYETDLGAATSVLREAVDRSPRVLADPPPMIVLTRYGASSIDFTIYYWHASDVPSELVTRHDLILASHQALAAAGITIAFPQLVVWEGKPGEQPTYTDTLDRVHVQHPGVEDGGADSQYRHDTKWRLRRRNQQ